MYYIDNLSNVEIGKKAIVKTIYSKGTMRRRLQDIGIISGSKIECLQKSTQGGICAYFVRGAVIAIRGDDTKNIIVEIT